MPKEVLVGPAFVVEDQQGALDDELVIGEVAAHGRQLGESGHGVGQMLNLQADVEVFDVGEGRGAGPPRLEEPRRVVKGCHAGNG